MPRSVLCGRSYRLMHADELRAGHVLWPEPMNAPCVHDLGRFVKSHDPPPPGGGGRRSLTEGEEAQDFDESGPFFGRRRFPPPPSPSAPPPPGGGGLGGGSSGMTEVGWLGVFRQAQPKWDGASGGRSFAHLSACNGKSATHRFRSRSAKERDCGPGCADAVSHRVSLNFALLEPH